MRPIQNSGSGEQTRSEQIAQQRIEIRSPCDYRDVHWQERLIMLDDLEMIAMHPARRVGVHVQGLLLTQTPR